MKIRPHISENESLKTYKYLPITYSLYCSNVILSSLASFYTKPFSSSLAGTT